MDVFRLTGPSQLRGVVDIRGAKNSVLKLMAASLLAVGRTTISNVPAILDVRIMVELLVRLGCSVDYDAEAGVVSIDVPEQVGIQADYELVRAMRASISVLGPLTARMRSAHVALPGGDAIGSRGLDMHQAGLEALGATVHLDHGYFVAEAPEGLQGTEISLQFPSVGATENLVMAATLAHGVTTISNAAKEPEIVDICSMLVEMGARIDGIGTPDITVTGVSELRPVDHRTVGDRIVAGTYAFGAALSGGDVTVRGVGLDLMPNIAIKLRDAGATVDPLDGIELGDGTLGAGFRVRGADRPKAIRVATMPFPGFPTDLQPFVIALNSVAEGTGLLSENLFEARWRFVQEIARLGAKVRIDGNHALISGVEGLSGAEVEASDIRAGAGLVMAGLRAVGITEVSGIDHIERGYENFVTNLRSLGADIERVEKRDILTFE
ncbi:MULTISPECIES: UDP-N-acetylglucosamine 1-carboxyvinyltransferase [unclassified Brevibacterium]|uniref:UDP-N-acetylglucosamine 1-carboxyvinyltransferase n=1 Tax=unclassified Brevibacterium TaxID=2614124 RepID=UPI001E57A875|nr:MULTISPECIES: UDP-N-acetylglucosamine 1-carboxyvinyltransferase [unclassified Brevibacterium]MCD1284662.1 UDP-N-acetylglucosamine 1-carboxyvinyltransferase [Brevibacterium sp. CCUG 69071]MDK8435720.1 UDP-N-acetylglucosamine 1-carboxyvinyltransferase [Brevibacterium sp. H-BE7]